MFWWPGSGMVGRGTKIFFQVKAPRSDTNGTVLLTPNRQMKVARMIFKATLSLALDEAVLVQPSDLLKSTSTMYSNI